MHYRATDTNTYGAIRRFFERNGTFFSLAASAGLVAILFTYGSVTDAYPGVWAIFPTLCAVLLIVKGQVKKLALTKRCCHVLLWCISVG